MNIIFAIFALAVLVPVAIWIVLKLTGDLMSIVFRKNKEVPKPFSDEEMEKGIRDMFKDPNQSS